MSPLLTTEMLKHVFGRRHIRNLAKERANVLSSDYSWCTVSLFQQCCAARANLFDLVAAGAAERDAFRSVDALECIMSHQEGILPPAKQLVPLSVALDGQFTHNLSKAPQPGAQEVCGVGEAHCLFD